MGTGACETTPSLLLEGAVRGLLVVVWWRGLLSWVRRMEEEEEDEAEEGEVGIARAAVAEPVVATGLPGMRNVADRVT